MVNVPSSTEQPGALKRPVSTRDLLPSECRFLIAMHELGFGSVESTPIRNGELILDPWPTIIRSVKFGSEASAAFRPTEEFLLKRQVAEFFEYVRAVDDGEIRCLEVRHGLPFSMEIEHRPDSNGRTL